MAKNSSAKQKKVVDEQVIKPKTMFQLKLSRFELLHLRDLFSVCLQPISTGTVSQNLAKTQKRSIVEEKLWEKIAAQCTIANLPLGDEAPDFIVAALETPPLTVYEVSSDPSQQDDDEAQSEDAEGN